jgi:DNA-binding NtrC family response regulator
VASPCSSIPLEWKDGRRLLDVVREASLAAERVAIVDTLRQVQWNRRKAAQRLGVSYKTLLNKIKETGIDPADEKPVSVARARIRPGRCDAQALRFEEASTRN